MPGRPRIVPELPVPVRTSLRDRGFKSEDAADPTLPWVRAVDDAAAAVELVHELITAVFEEKPDVALDIAHASHRAEHEAQQKLAVVRERLERVLSEIAGGRPEQDADGDYLLPMGGVRVTVAPRVSPGGPVIVRVFAITNVGVTVAPALGLFLARLNFGLMFGRFALDAEHSAIWFDETLLGDQLTDEALRFTVGIVAEPGGRVGRPPPADVWRRDLPRRPAGSHQSGIPPTNPAAVATSRKPAAPQTSSADRRGPSCRHAGNHPDSASRLAPSRAPSSPHGAGRVRVALLGRLGAPHLRAVFGGLLGRHQIAPAHRLGGSRGRRFVGILRMHEGGRERARCEERDRDQQASVE